MVERSTRSAGRSIVVRSSEEGTQSQESRRGASPISRSTTFHSDTVDVQAPMSLNRRISTDISVIRVSVPIPNAYFIY
ncbi:hypothetical protein V1524DRAFT_442705 [Lipomyces starkeyi]